MAFESVPWTHEDIYAYVVMRSIIGSAAAFSSGGPGKGMYCRAITHMMQRHGCILSANCIASHFIDSGLFGIKAIGPGSHPVDILSSILETLHGLRLPIKSEELNRHKNIVKMSMFAATEKDEHRLEEMIRNYATYGELNFMNYTNKVSEVTSE